eukprot:gnl/TRDRNA2_/TRDRNA2_183752_c0_seq1.p1 gnl/TRDRNA2_/TRDRNA2_183752_c0~~gnl/TRDRNA2_/TRDRNA2_183752_c0_seq1.p1  ORF type:complete len:432 (+),score=92.86 gnl/TRDRNA2_/TRDRNA2_183752_c0_seq1:82-1377(+)
MGANGSCQGADSPICATVEVTGSESTTVSANRLAPEASKSTDVPEKSDAGLFRRRKLVTGMTDDTATEVEVHIAEVLKTVLDNDKERVREHIYALVSMAWHDRDDEISHLRKDLKKERDCVVKYSGILGVDLDSNQAGRTMDFDAICHNAQRLVVVSSAIPQLDTFKDAVIKPEWVVEYDHEKTSLAELSSAIKAKAEVLKPMTVCLANHGTDAAGCWSVARDLCIDVTGEKPELSEEAKVFFKQLADSCKQRVDLLACDLAATESGLALIKELESYTGRHFAASTNHTGNLKHGGDWVLETEQVDTACIYFDHQKLYKWHGALTRKGAIANVAKKIAMKSAAARDARKNGGNSDDEYEEEDNFSSDDEYESRKRDRDIFQVYTAVDYGEAHRTKQTNKKLVKTSPHNLGKGNRGFLATRPEPDGPFKRIA